VTSGDGRLPLSAAGGHNVGMDEERSEVSTCGEVDTKQACRPGQRRQWPAALKRKIVEETFAPGASASVVARRHDVNANQLFRWRRDWRDGLLGGAAEGAAEQRLVQVAVAEERPAPVAGVIEIELGAGVRVRACGAVDAATLRQVLEVLGPR
jgi:transposase